MSAEKPSAFSKRLRSHPSIAKFPADAAPGDLAVLAASDRLLVSSSASTRVHSFFAAADHGFRGERITTVFGPPEFHPQFADSQGIDDIEIWKVGLPTGEDVFSLTDKLRETLPGEEHKVSPNHVLIPASNGDECPDGPPRPANSAPPSAIPAELVPDLPEGATTSVTIIDSGYVEWGPNNPLDNLCAVAYHHGREHHGQGNAPWTDSAPDSVPGKGHLYALAGHGNFSAGIVARHCSANPSIAIWNYNGQFAANAQDLPLESDVCQTILLSQDPASGGGPSKVILVGFAFPVYGQDPSGQDVVPDVWIQTLTALASGGQAPILVAPAGNQDDTDRRYPAALNWRFPGVYPNVVGVASIDPTPGYARSGFSNYGTDVAQPGNASNNWVTCSAVGRDVVSTFLDVDLQPEEEPDKALPHAFTGWAKWNGTSFAAPKVAALAATYCAAYPLMAPVDAWNRLLGRLPDAAPDVGARFEF